MSFSVAVYQCHRGDELVWATVGLGADDVTRSGHSGLKLHRAIVAALKRRLEQLGPDEVERFHVPRGMRLVRVRLELTLRGAKKRKVSGLFPVILEPRWASATAKIVAAYHPLRPQEWFPASDAEALEERATIWFSRAWAELEDGELALLPSDQRDALRSISFDAKPKALLDHLPDQPKDPWHDLVQSREGAPAEPGPRTLELLPRLGASVTHAAIEGTLATGLPRAPYRDQLQRLLCGREKRSVIVVGAQGSGKSTVLHQLVADRLEADDWASHQNLDRIHEVWRISGKRIIAGMSHVGDWEQRVVELLEEVKRRGRVVLWVDDLHAFGRIGQARDSERCLADVLRGPVARGDLVVVAECTPEQLQRLEDEAPSFAVLFTQVRVAPTSTDETLRMMMHEARDLERRSDLAISPWVYRTILELGGSLFPSAAFPGKALDLLRELARESDADESRAAAEIRELHPADVITVLSKKTGLPKLLLEPTERLDPADVTRALEREVLGQPEAIRAAVDLVVRIKAGLQDPSRPWGVYLFTGPTGTGKTELATAIATYLYGERGRLLRFDMSEHGGPDAPARLIGDRFAPEGRLTQAILDQPFSVVLLDEIEKAHPAVLNLLLQLFDEGRLTDAKGNTADFRHAVVIMTSNLGARERAAVGFEGSIDQVLFDIAREVKEFFPPELFNRIDRVVPFRPLSGAVALKIAERELSKLVSRRGLAGRGIFVYANAGVHARIVREGFDPRDGARPVKRWIERELGGLLARELVAQRGRTTLQIFRIFDAAGELRLHADRLVEADPSPTPSPLEPMLELSAAELAALLPEAKRFLRELLASERFEALEEQLRRELSAYNRGDATEDADVIYDLERLRQRLDELATRLDLERRQAPGPELDVDEDRYVEQARGPRRQSIDRRSAKTQVRPFGREEMLAVIAEVHFLERALSLAHDPRQHHVFVELLRVGRSLPLGLRMRDEPATPPFLELLTKAYLAGRVSLESWAVMRGGDLSHGTGIDALDVDGADHVVLELRGLCVLELYASEQGSHLVRSLSGTELVRVRVEPAARGVTAEGLVRAHEAARAIFEGALERGDEPLPPNPEALLPAVRAIHVDVPDRESSAALVDVEDYVLGHSMKLRARTLDEVLARSWILKMGQGSRGPATRRPGGPS
ncbi:AAA family ATPase [Myxococcota bacterium]|nr:AAA family ATPase [Myxococcota bacterium]